MKTKSLYISSNASSATWMIVSMGLLSALQENGKKIAFFKPIVSCKSKDELNFLVKYFKLPYDSKEAFAYSLKEAKNLIASGKANELYEGILDKFENLKSKFDFVLCQGISQNQIDAVLDFNLNLEIAKHLNSPLINVIDADEKSLEEILCELNMESLSIEKTSCFKLASFINKIDDKIIENLNKEYKDLLFCLPKIHNISLPQILEDEKKATLVLESFKKNICTKSLFEALELANSTCQTPIRFQYQLFQRAKSDVKTIVLPESQDDRILQASDILRQKDAVNVVLLGDEKAINKRAKELNINLSGIKIINPIDSAYLDEFANTFYELRKSKGISLEEAKKTVQNQTYFGTMMVHLNYADGMVSGAVNTTADTIRPAFQIIKTKPGISIVSSVFFMCLDTKVLCFGDCAVNPSPSFEEVSQIAITSASTAKVFGMDPKVAMLSYSTGASGKGEDVEKVIKATELTKKNAPNLSVDGPLQYDASVDMDIASKKLPGSKVAGSANVFIFPDLDAGNICYKAVQRSANALAIGPVLQGLNKPINDLSRGCLVEDIVNTVAITAIQAQGD